MSAQGFRRTHAFAHLPLQADTKATKKLESEKQVSGGTSSWVVSKDQKHRMASHVVCTLTIGKTREGWQEQACLRSAAVLNPLLERDMSVSTTFPGQHDTLPCYSDFPIKTSHLTFENPSLNMLMTACRLDGSKSNKTKSSFLKSGDMHSTTLFGVPVPVP